MTDRLEIGLEGTHAVGAHHAADLILQLGHELPCDREHLVTAVAPTALVGAAHGGATVVDVEDPAHPSVSATIPPAADGTASVAARADGTLGVVTDDSGDPTVRTIELADPHHPAVLGAAPATVSQSDLVLLAGGRFLATVGDDGRLTLWNLADPARPAPVSTSADPAGTEVDHVAVSADSSLIATSSNPGSAPGHAGLRLWDVTDPVHPVPRGAPPPIAQDVSLSGPHTDGVGAIAFTPDGHTIAGVRGDGAIGLWDVTDPGDPRPRGVLVDPTGEYGALAVAPDGHTLATTTRSGDTALDLWDITDPDQPVRGGRISLETSRSPLVFRGDGELIFLDSSTLRVADARLDQLSRRVCAAAGAELSADQWRRFVGVAPARVPLCGA